MNYNTLSDNLGASGIANLVSRASNFCKGAIRRLKRAWHVILTGNDGLHLAPQTVVVQNQSSPMPQAVLEDNSIQVFEKRNWREHFSRQLKGLGLEIGPLHRPIPTHPGMKVDYIDRYSVEYLRAHYPELRDLPIVEPNIIGDAETLAPVENAKYDFLVSAHVIEHMRNPIGSIEQWCRVLKPGGLIYLIVPDKRVIFDSQRVRTTLEHLILDYRRPSAERDLEHCLDYGVFVHGKRGNAAIDEMDNIVNTDYSIHFHTFIPIDVINILNWVSENIRKVEILEGPCMTPGEEEFHFLIKVH